MTADVDTEYSECVDRLYSIAPSFQRVGVSGFHPGLDSMLAFSACMGNPHKDLECIHIAGTNGKGSVAHMLASALAFAKPGSSIGLYTSPHLVDFRERIRTITSSAGTDGRFFKEIGKDEVVEFMHRYGSFIEDRHPSFFEITTAMAFNYFRQIGVDMAVIETGLGGRLDSTNIVLPKVSIITSIGLDHKDILGDTIERIAFEKSGIIKPGVPVVTGNLPVEAMKVVEQVARERGCVLYRSTELYADSPVVECAAAEADLRSDCQRQNIATVLTALHVLGLDEVREHDSVFNAITHAAAVSGLRGRWERLRETPVVVCDIGHNVEALTVSMRQLRKEAQGKHIIMVFGMAGDKDVVAVKDLLPVDATYLFTQAEGSRAMPADDLMKIAGVRDARAFAHVREAVDAALAMATDSDYIYIGGSSYVVAEAMAHFL